jgi:hypothetical protein
MRDGEQRTAADLSLQIIFHCPHLTRDHALEEDLGGLLSEQSLLDLSADESCRPGPASPLRRSNSDQ